MPGCSLAQVLVPVTGNAVPDDGCDSYTSWMAITSTTDATVYRTARPTKYSSIHAMELLRYERRIEWHI